MYHTLYILLILVCTALIFAREDHERKLPSRFEVARSEPDDISTDPDSRALYWLPTICDAMAERGYTCNSCESSMHCMFNNVGLVALCYGRRPYCNNGVCSDLPSEKCRNKLGEVSQNSTLVVHQGPHNEDGDGHGSDTMPKPKQESLGIKV